MPLAAAAAEGEMGPSPLDWPIAFAGGAANGIAWAQLLFESCFQCPGMGPISPSAAAAANGIA